MILAQLDVPDSLVPPSGFRREANKRVDIEVEGARYGEDIFRPDGIRVEWISTKRAPPHTDECWKGSYFLTLSLVNGFEVGDVKEGSGDDYDIFRGALFVIDPTTKHWLYHSSDWQRRCPDASWIGLQWTVPKRRAPAVARSLVEFYNGKWLQHSDLSSRYEKWKPK
jgi:hypothetical protein